YRCPNRSLTSAAAVHRLVASALWTRRRLVEASMSRTPRSLPAESAASVMSTSSGSGCAREFAVAGNVGVECLCAAIMRAASDCEQIADSCSPSVSAIAAA
ncbi:MAG: hypothetical protein ABIZ80_21245, partial [Bryobacteraceae bacterium]